MQTSAHLALPVGVDLSPASNLLQGWLGDGAAIMRQMHLVAFLMTGPSCHHHGAWRHPDSDIDDILSPERYEHIARVLEAGCFDALFFADILGLYDL